MTASDHGPGGKFAHGNQAARKRKQTGSRNRVSLMLDKLAEDRASDLMEELQAKAINDRDLEALTFLLDRLWPKRKGGPPITIDLPKIRKAEDVLEAHNRIIAAVACGGLTIEEGQALAALIDRSREAIATATLAVELAELKAMLAKNGDADVQG